MDVYDAIIHNDDPENRIIEKITVRLWASDKVCARLIGEAIAKTILPLSKTAIEVEFRIKGELVK